MARRPRVGLTITWGLLALAGRGRSSKAAVVLLFFSLVMAEGGAYYGYISLIIERSTTHDIFKVHWL